MAIYWGQKSRSKCRGFGILRLTCFQSSRLLCVVLKPFLKELTVRDNCLMLNFFPQYFFYLVIDLDVALRYIFFPFYTNEN